MSIAPVTRGWGDAAPCSTVERDQWRAADLGVAISSSLRRLDGQQLAQFAQSFGAALA